jgi:serine/threonine-protein kinase RsbW
MRIENRIMATRKSQKFKLKFSSDTVYLEKVEKLSSKVARLAGLSESISDDLGIVTTELVNNAIHHGNKNDPDKEVQIIFTIDEDKIELRIRDQGNGFSPEELKDPLAPENLFSESGRGIFLIRNLMDSLEFKFSDTGTETIVTKNLR